MDRPRKPGVADALSALCPKKPLPGLILDASTVKRLSFKICTASSSRVTTHAVCCPCLNGKGICTMGPIARICANNGKGFAEKSLPNKLIDDALTAVLSGWLLIKGFLC